MYISILLYLSLSGLARRILSPEDPSSFFSPLHPLSLYTLCLSLSTLSVSASHSLSDLAASSRLSIGRILSPQDPEIRPLSYTLSLSSLSLSPSLSLTWRPHRGCRRGGSWARRIQSSPWPRLRWFPKHSRMNNWALAGSISPRIFRESKDVELYLEAISL